MGNTTSDLKSLYRINYFLLHKLSNNPNLMLNEAKGSILNDEI